MSSKLYILGSSVGGVITPLIAKTSTEVLSPNLVSSGYEDHVVLEAGGETDAVDDRTI